MKPPDPSVEELKQGVRRFLVWRLAIGLPVLVIAAIYIFWPR